MSKIAKLFFLLLISVSLFAADELEVRLATRVPLKRLYLTHCQMPDEIDWRYTEELREVLGADFDRNGFSTLVPGREEWDKTIYAADPKRHFDLAFWKKQQICHVVCIQGSKQAFCATVFQIEKGTSKRYPEIALTGKLDVDRRAMHRLADQIQKDLFGVQGIASLRLLFSQRVRNEGSKGPEWLSDIWIADSDGANAQRLTTFAGYCMSPGFLPSSLSGKEGAYYFVSTAQGQSKIYRASLTGGKPYVWVNLRGNQLLPALTRNGSQMAFISDAAGRPDLFIQNLNASGEELGKPRQIYSAPAATQASPTYSPDGKKLAFVSDKDGTARIYVLDIPDPRDTRRAHPRLISRKNRENTSPCWSPDGTKLAYSARTEGVRQIWIYDVAEEMEWQLTSGDENKENPSFAPDSLHLVYNTETYDVSEMYLIDLHRQEPLRIGAGFGQKRFASWEMR